MNVKIKTALYYAIFVAAGIGGGYVVQQLRHVEKPIVEHGEYNQYLNANQASILLYGTATCPFCQKARAYFKNNNIEFADLDIQAKPNLKNEYTKLEGVGVPLILIGNTLIRGFSIEHIEEALQEARQKKVLN